MQNISSYISSSALELKELIKTLCAITAPSGDEGRRAAFCLEWLRSAGAERAYMDEALNVICPFGDTEGEVTIFTAHTDTVFPDLESMPMTERDGRLYCPGVGDDTANLAILLLCARYMLQNNIAPAKGGVLLVADSGEEGLGNLRGMRRLMSDFAGRVKQVIALDDGIGGIVNSSVGSARYRISVKTAGGHSFGDFGSPNAIAVLAGLITRLYSLAPPERGASRTTYNVGVIEGGTSINTIPQSACVLYEYRSTSARCLEEMESLFRAAVASFRQEGAEITVEELGVRPCDGAVPKKAQTALLDLCSAVIRQVAGCEPTLSSGSTDCNIPLSLGIPAICTGGYIGEGAHKREEWIDLSSLPTGMEIVLTLILRLLQQ